MINIKKNFFGFNLDTAKISGYEDHIKVAVNSCIENTSLQTYFLYCGHDKELLNWLKSKPITLVDTSSFKLINTLLERNSSNMHLPTAKGAWQRLLIPEVCQKLDIKDKHVLYTDVDVMFTPNMSKPINLNVDKFACAKEGGDSANYNTGTMIINRKYLESIYNSFMDFCIKHSFNFIAFDQGALNAFIHIGHITILDHHEWNLSSYMHAPIENCRIFHFHGPKAIHLKSYLSGAGKQQFPEIYWDLLNRSNRSIQKSCLDYHNSFLIN
jgi:lipopolysaccharide biosynthesis glycosyltransferase